MGLLDDAIREHLDLKRRRGADPAEVERAEREALGPVRRNQGPAVADPDDELETDDAAYDQADDELVTEGAAYDQTDEEDWAYAEADDAEPLTQADPPPLQFSEEPEPSEPEPAEPEPRRPARAFDAEDDPFEDEPFAPRARDDIAGTETAEYNVADALEAEGEDEDVLEETPEFLQDTPDHDRLWFEQRPPRDFDFDG